MFYLIIFILQKRGRYPDFFCALEAGKWVAPPPRVSNGDPHDSYFNKTLIFGKFFLIRQIACENNINSYTFIILYFV